MFNETSRRHHRTIWEYFTERIIGKIKKLAKYLENKLSMNDFQKQITYHEAAMNSILLISHKHRYVPHEKECFNHISYIKQ